MSIKSFKDLEIWQDSIKISMFIYKIISSSPQFKHDYSLKDQITRSSVSIPSNIAEGFERDNNNEFIYFLRIAKGSCAELITQLEITYKINYVNTEIYEKLSTDLNILNAKIGKFISYLKINRQTYKPNKLTR